MKHQLLLLLIAHVLVISVAAETLYVRPENDTIACHDHSSVDHVLPCFTLSQYASNASFFTSNTTLVLLPGNHVLDSNPLFITNITLLEVLASSANETQISCNNTSGFSFEKIRTVHIRGLSFVGCDRNKVMFVEKLMMEDSKFDGQGGSSSGLDLVDIIHANITMCSFVLHVGAERLVSFTHPFNRFSVGGAMYISNSSVDVWSSFFNNNTAHYGGAVYIVNGHLALHNSVFSDNSATGSLQLGTGRGGAVYIVHHSTINITSGNIFNRNTATSDGGALYNLRSSVLVVNNGNVFTNNRANYGGTLYSIHNSTVDLFDNNTFRNNTSIVNGGAIYNTHQSTTTIVGGNTFIYNKAVYGGAIYNVETSVITIADGNVFTNNEAVDSGGALCCFTFASVSITGNNTFINNKAKYGGAILTSQNSTTMIFSQNTFMDNRASSHGGAIKNVELSSTSVYGTNTFTNNSAPYGGGVYNAIHSTLTITDGNTFSDNTADDDGGAVLNDEHSNVEISESNVFINNEAVDSGGALCCFTFARVLITGNNTFISNKAKYGGAILTRQNSTIAISYQNIFMDNRASGHGGAIKNVESSSMSIYGTNTIANNSAPYGGGVYNAIHSTLTITGGNTFSDNTADDDGGAVLNDRHSTVEITDSNTFSNNVAFDSGGALCCFTFANTSITGNNTFISNKAKYGGAILTRQNSTTTIFNQNTFMDNRASSHGGAIDNYESGTTTIIGSNTFTNNSAEFGGAVDNAIHSTLTIIDGNTFSNNTADDGGAVLNKQNSTLALLYDNTFTDNRAASNGGAIVNVVSSKSAIYSTNVLPNNSAPYGGAVYNAIHSTLTITDGNTFSDNTADDDGGAVLNDQHSILEISDSNVFNNNVAFDQGGAVLNIGGSTTTVTNNNTFTNNKATIAYGGAMFCDRFSSITITDSNTFSNNSAKDGGGAVYNAGEVIINHRNTISNNMARVGHGGAIYNDGHGSLTLTSNNTLEGNTAFSGGALYISQDSISTISGENMLVSNKAIDGGALYTNGEIIFTTDSDVYFVDNQADRHGGGMYLSGNSATHLHGHVNVTSNKALSGGGVYVHSSHLNIMGNITMSYNRAAKLGGGFCLNQGSIIHVLKNSEEIDQRNGYRTVHKMSFTNNTAEYGGAIYVNDSSIPETCTSTRSSVTQCFLQVPQLQSPEHNHTTTQQNYFNFSNNNAEVAGPALYGGLLDRCTLSINRYNNTMEAAQVNKTDHYFYPYNAIENIKRVSNIVNEEKSLIASNAVRVCFCSNGRPNCTHQPPPIYTFKGRTIKLSVVGVDQVNNIVPAIIHSSLSSPETGSIFGGQLTYCQNVSGTCTEFTFSLKTSARVLFYADGPCQDKGISESQIQVNFIPCTCPLGFQPSSSQFSCECECHRDLPYISNCFRDSGKLHVERKSDFWIGVSNKTDANDTTFISVPFCPYDYCHPATESVLVNLNDPNGSDVQCAFNRSGKVCGSCKDGLSLVFGSSRCKPCSNHHLALLVPFAIAGIALVVFLLVCNLTVAVGTLNGLIFYANIVIANRVVFFPHGATSFLTVAISWISLNLGIETCFYDGMDAYAKMWLQFAFDIYIIVLVICIIIACKYTNTFARLLYGKNPVATLATLILLSYEKLSRKLFSLLAFATIDHTDGSREGVWLFDPNLPYLRGKHIALLIMFIVIFIFGSAFNGLLCFGQCLPHLPRQKIFQWVRNTKFSAFLDAYHAPYNPKHRYWVGLLLLVRVILYLILEVNAAGDARINLLSVISAGVGLLLVKLFIWGSIYKTRAIDMLETTFTINLIIFAASTLYAREANGNQTGIAYTSFTIVLVTFLGILTYHTYKYTLKYTTMKKYIKKLVKAAKGSFMNCCRANDMKDCDTQMMDKKVVKNLKSH